MNNNQTSFVQDRNSKINNLLLSPIRWRLKGTSGYSNKVISWDKLCIDNRKDASKNVFCATAEYQLIIFELKCMILNCDNNWGDPFKPYLPTPSPRNFISQQ